MDWRLRDVNVGLQCGKTFCASFYASLIAGSRRAFLFVIIHSTHYLFSDWPKTFSEFSKSASGTSSSCRLYNNHVKDTQGHGQSCHVWPRCMISKDNLVKFERFVLLAVSEEAKTWLLDLLLWPSKTEKMVEDWTHKTQKGRRRWQSILGDPEAVSRVGRKGGTKVFKYGQRAPGYRLSDAGSWLGTKNALYYCAQSANSFSWVLCASS